MNGNIVWTGEIKKGCGNTYDNYCTLIKINSTIQVDENDTDEEELLSELMNK